VNATQTKIPAKDGGDRITELFVRGHYFVRTRAFLGRALAKSSAAPINDPINRYVDGSGTNTALILNDEVMVLVAGKRMGPV